MELITLIVSLITLCVALTVLVLVLIYLYQDIKHEIQLPTIPKIFKTKESEGEQDAYTPNYADNTTPIEDFEPDFSKPIKVNLTVDDVKKEFTTSEGEQMTPLKTDDVFTEDEDKR